MVTMAFGCQGDPNDETPSTGGSGTIPNQGGMAPTLGGASGTTTGGSSGTGAGSGGTTTTGGTTATGGSFATGGTSTATGGSFATGGTSTTGGSFATGGTTTGGTTNTGGATNTGGVTNTGGTTATGGTSTGGGNTGGKANTGGAATGGTTGTGGGSSCQNGQTSCSGSCVSLTNNNSNCGSCGVACTGGRTCTNSACNCPSGQTFCSASNTCATTTTDVNNCGTCGNKCQSGGTCVNGGCMTPNVTCPAEQEQSGHITYYTLAADPACHYGRGSLPQYFGAMNTQDYATAAACGACVEITNQVNGKKIQVQIIDECPIAGNEKWCFNGSHHIDLNTAAYQALSADNNPAIKWHYVPCAVTGNIKYLYDGTATAGWLSLAPENHRHRVTKIEVQKDGSYQQLTRMSYNTFVLASGAGGGPFKFRLTDVYGHVVEDPSVQFSAGQLVTGAVQFPACN